MTWSIILMEGQEMYSSTMAKNFPQLVTDTRPSIPAAPQCGATKEIT